MAQVIDELLTPAQAAHELGVHGSSIRRWALSGLIPGAVQTPGGWILVPRAGLQGLLKPLVAAEHKPKATV